MFYLLLQNVAKIPAFYIYFIAETVGLHKKGVSVLLKSISYDCTFGSHTSCI